MPQQTTVDKFMDTVVAHMPTTLPAAESVPPGGPGVYTAAEWPIAADWCATIEQMFADQTDPLITPAGIGVGRGIAEPALAGLLTGADFGVVFSAAITAYAGVCTGLLIPPGGVDPSGNFTTTLYMGIPTPPAGTGTGFGTVVPPAAPATGVVAPYLLSGSFPNPGPSHEDFIKGLYAVVKAWAMTGTGSNNAAPLVAGGWIWA